MDSSVAVTIMTYSFVILAVSLVVLIVVLIGKTIYEVLND